ncbi:MAG: hypothetical protein JO113_02035 [Candidatus Eremiobacteraeota bacterium]|nr:hypothetical protein [Candidatus Eremiobacteraeota bacterium]
MKGLFAHKIFAAAIGIAILAACGGSGGVPTAAQALQVPANSFGDAATSNLSGQFSGTQVDKVHGTEKLKGSFAQYGSAVGGPLRAIGAHTVTADEAWVISGSAVHGSSVVPSGGGYCTFSVEGKWNGSNYRLTGKFYAVSGCSGERGTFTLKQQCFYNHGSSDDVLPDNGPRSC